MKNFLFTSLVLLCINTVSAQTDSTNNKFGFGVAVNTSFSFATEFTHAPLLTYSNGKHQFELGPKLGFRDVGYYKNQFGVEFNYKFFPNTSTKKFSSFLHLNASFFNRTLERDYIQPYGTPYVDYLVSQKATRRYYDLHAGYGVQYNFTPKLYVSTNIGFGLNIEEYDDNRVSSNPELSSYKGYAFEGLSLRAALTIGYRF